MILGFSPAQIVRAYAAAAISLGAAVYVGGLVTSDICHAYEAGTIVGRTTAVDVPAGKALVRARPMLCP